jgi:hypothetical protein
VPIGLGFGGVLGDRWRTSLHLVFVGTGLAIATLAGLSSVLRGIGSVFESPRREGIGGFKMPGAKNFVSAAMTHGLAGKASLTPSTRPYGCVVKY